MTPPTIEPRRPALVLGTAPCWRDDIEQVPAFTGRTLDDFDVVAVNDAGVNYQGRISAWVSIHGDKLKGWMAEREEIGGNADFVAVGKLHKNLPTLGVVRHNRQNRGGSSALYAVDYCIEMGYRRIVVAGCPLEGETRMERGEEVKGGSAAGYDHYRKGWKRPTDEMAEGVRGMSGYPADVLGMPTAEWLESGGVPEPTRDRD